MERKVRHFEKMLLHPIEAGNYVELRKKIGKALKDI
jgi:hypothetical protein